ncbi:MAG: hypothetical protein V8S81_04915 [Oscillospiraceae bacterium]
MTTIPMEPGPVDAFMQAHPERGALRIQVTAGPFPVAGAQVEVFRLFGQLRQVFYRGVTDQSGILQGIALPALPAAWSQSSDTADVSATDYQVTVRHPMFAPDVGRTPPSTRARRRSSPSRSSRCCKGGVTIWRSPLCRRASLSTSARPARRRRT